MVIAGQGDAFGTHGAIIMLCSLAVDFTIISGYYAPETSPERLTRSYDDPRKVAIIIAMNRAVLRIGVGVCISAIIACPHLPFDPAGSRCAPNPPVHHHT